MSQDKIFYSARYIIENNIKITDICIHELTEAIMDDRVCPVVLEAISVEGIFSLLPESKLLDYFEACSITSSKYLPIKTALAKKIFNRR